MNAEQSEVAFWTIAELADHWRCSKRSIFRRLSEGKLIGHKFGSHWRISDADRLAYERAHRQS